MPNPTKPGYAVGYQSPTQRPIDSKGNPIKDTPTDTTGLLTDILNTLRKLVDRLTPEPMMIPVQFNNIVTTKDITVDIPYGYNAILCCLQPGGIVRVYFSSQATTVPDIEYYGVDFPNYTPFPMRYDHQITFRAIGTALLPLNGTIFVMAY